jgi:integrase
MSTIRKSTRINGVLKQARFTRKADATLWYADQIREKELARVGMSLPLTPIKFQDFYEKWIAGRKNLGKADSTLRVEKERIENHVIPAFGKRQLHTISTTEFDSFLNNMVHEHGISFSTRNRYRSILHKLYSDAIKLRYTLQNPLTNIERLPEPIDPYDYFESSAECELYLKFSKTISEDFHLLVIIALNSGMRLGEILALQVRDINFEMEFINVFKTYDFSTSRVKTTTKGKKGRRVGISESLKQTLWKYRMYPKDMFLFKIDDSFPSHTFIYRRHERVLKLAGLKRIRFHDLRHTFASHFIMNGGSVSELQSILGHSTVRMTERYSHLAERHILSKANLVSFSGDENNVLPLVMPK